jgi:DNA polymerase-3 subunit gamma/tau
MPYLALARKSRPQKFSEVISQEHITKTLSNAILAGRIHHAYLFSGPRGTGKTTTARIVAKSLNCANPNGAEPCDQCPSCRDIINGVSPNVIEIDAASNRGIDDVRNLREFIRYSPVGGKYKIYIIDEVHQLTSEAFNALLKTLEEPPAHGVFVFATTEPQRVPLTVLSRCLRFDFRLLPFFRIAEFLQRLCDDEGVKMEPEALNLLASKAEGSMRDGLSLLDQILSFGERKISLEMVTSTLGIMDRGTLFALSEAIFNRESAKALKIVNDFALGGGSLELLATSLQEHLRNLLFAKVAPTASELFEVTDKDLERYRELAEGYEESDILRAINIFCELETTLKRKTSEPRIATEITIVKAASLDRTVKIEKILKQLSSQPSLLSLGASVNQTQMDLMATEAQEEVEAQKDTTPSAEAQARGKREQIHTTEQQKTEVSPPAADSPSLEAIQEKWGEFVDRLKSEKHRGLAKNSRLVGLVNDTLMIGVHDDITKSMFESSKDRSVLDQAIRDTFGEKLKVGFKILPKELKEAKGEGRKAEATELKKVLEKEKEVREILDTFGGEVVGFVPKEKKRKKD